MALLHASSIAGKIALYRYRSGYCGVSFLVENKHTASLVFMLDCSKSKNVVSHRPSLKHQQTIPPGEAKIMHHLLPDSSDVGAWSWAYAASYMFDEN
jgi:hypothetical protein